MTVLGLVLLVIGVGIAVIGTIGVYRLPDVYARIKALALVNLAAAVLVHVATELVVPMLHGTKGFLTAALFLISGPMLCQAILQAAHHLREPGEHRVDALREAEDDPL